MEIDEQALRIEGIYKQNSRGEFMQRVKLPGGVLSLAQADALAGLGQAYGGGTLHLTTRASIEFHDLLYENLPEVHRGLAAVGLFSRGACGGAVRGISCSSSFGPGFGRVQVLLRHFLRHFSGNPHFEGLPKKFKIAFEAGYERSRHLIQDLALVLVEEQGGRALYDVWLAGGLGREPQPGFLYAERVAEEELLPLAEAVVEVYRAWGEKGRRLKHMLNAVGEADLRAQIEQRRAGKEGSIFADAFAKELLPDGRFSRIPLRVLAGEFPAVRLAELVALARGHQAGWLLVTPDQDIEVLLEGCTAALEVDLRKAGFELASPDDGVLRVCPGNHECRMGLSATRDLARTLEETFGDRLKQRTLAISGCPNSCAQPQLADFGIVSSKLLKQGEERIPSYDLYRREGSWFGKPVLSQVPQTVLLERLGEFFSE